MAHHDDDSMAVSSAKFKTLLHQRRADALVLKLGQDCHRCESQRRDRPGLTDDEQVAEQNVADDLAFLLGNQGQPGEAAVTKGINQFGLAVLTEGEAVDVSDGFEVCGGFEPDERRPAWNGNERIPGPDNDWLGEVHPAALTHSRSRQQTQALPGAGVNLEDHHLLPSLYTFQVKAVNEPVVRKAESEVQVFIK